MKEVRPAREVCPTCACADGAVTVGLKLAHQCSAPARCACLAGELHSRHIVERLVMIEDPATLEDMLRSQRGEMRDRAWYDLVAVGMAVLRLARVAGEHGHEVCTGVVDPTRVTLVDGELRVMPPAGFS